MRPIDPVTAVPPGPTMPFFKMNGLGNDFVVIDARLTGQRFDAVAIRAICNRLSGIGCDQVIVIYPPRVPGTDAFMAIFNADGGEVNAGGNASRCVAGLLARELERPEVILQTHAGILSAHVNGETATVDMGAPRFGWEQIPLAEEFADTTGIELQIGPIDAPILHTPSVVNIGNPHAIFWVEDVNAYDLERSGPLLENHPVFPERANISLARVLSPERIVARVWERGAGLTRACGTAACAIAVAAARKELTGRKVVVELPGGALAIEWRMSDDHILMTGPWALDGEGIIPPGLLEIAAPARKELVP